MNYIIQIVEQKLRLEVIVILHMKSFLSSSQAFQINILNFLKEYDVVRFREGRNSLSNKRLNWISLPNHMADGSRK
jgi:hypothetical protein